MASWHDKWFSTGTTFLPFPFSSNIYTERLIPTMATETSEANKTGLRKPSLLICQGLHRN